MPIAPNVPNKTDKTAEVTATIIVFNAAFQMATPSGLRPSNKPWKLLRLNPVHIPVVVEGVNENTVIYKIGAYTKRRTK